MVSRAVVCTPLYSPHDDATAIAAEAKLFRPPGDWMIVAGNGGNPDFNDYPMIQGCASEYLPIFRKSGILMYATDERGRMGRFSCFLSQLI